MQLDKLMFIDDTKKVNIWLFRRGSRLIIIFIIVFFIIFFIWEFVFHCLKETVSHGQAKWQISLYFVVTVFLFLLFKQIPVNIFFFRYFRINAKIFWLQLSVVLVHKSKGKLVLPVKVHYDLKYAWSCIGQHLLLLFKMQHFDEAF